MSSKPEIPQQLREMADNLGVDVDALLAQIEGNEPQPQQQQSAQDPAAAAAAAGGIGVAPAPERAAAPAEVPAEVRREPGQEGGESNEQRLERELAVATQQLGQTRQQLQAHTEGRVVGSGGLAGPVDNTPPTLAAIEPGIRFAVRNGLIPAESLRERFGDTIVDLFLNDEGGAI